MKSPVTKFDRELVAKARKFVQALRNHDAYARAMTRVGFDTKALDRGDALVTEAESAFVWEDEGRAWNFVSPTPERRVLEARYWHKDTRRRWRQRCFRDAELAAAKHGLKAWFEAATCIMRAFSLVTANQHRVEFRRDIERARGEKPVDAPRPKDTIVVELAGWYERWVLAARQVMRDSPEALASLGLMAGKAPRRLRNQHDSFGSAGLPRQLRVASK